MNTLHLPKYVMIPSSAFSNRSFSCRFHQPTISKLSFVTFPWGYGANKPCWGLLMDVPLPFFSPKKWAPHISKTIEVSSLRSSPTWIHLFTLMLNSRSFLGIGYLSCLPSVIFFISLVQLATNVQVIMHPKSMTLQLQGSDTQSVILLSIIWS